MLKSPSEIEARERELFDERAGILEYDCGLPRETAEFEAIEEIYFEKVERNLNETE